MYVAQINLEFELNTDMFTQPLTFYNSMAMNNMQGKPTCCLIFYYLNKQKKKGSFKLYKINRLYALTTNKVND